MRSLRSRLILLLGAAIAAAAVVQFVTAFQSAMHEANNLFDRHLEQMALAIKNTGVDAVDWYSPPSEGEEIYDFVIQIWTDGDVRVFQPRTYRFLPEQAGLGLSTVALENGDWRTFALKTDKRVIQVSQKMANRRSRAISFVLRALWPVIPVSFLLIFASWWVVTAALFPLNRIGSELANRDSNSLTPVSDKDAPKEISLLVQELNSLLARIKRAMRSQQQFLADAAHGLRSPLTALRLQVQTLSQARGEETREQAVNRLLGGVDRASRLVEQLLLLAGQDLSDSEVESAEVQFSECVAQAVADVDALAMFRRIRMECGPLDPVKLWGDAGSLQIMVRNLLDNAILYTQEGGTVRASLKRDGFHAVLLVEDSGPGIREEMRTRVFDRFYRIPGTRQTGSGLGLGIVKAIAERHGGIVALGDAAIGGLEVKVTFQLPPA